MSKITFPDKKPGDQLSASEVTQIKNVINANDDIVASILGILGISSSGDAIEDNNTIVDKLKEMVDVFQNFQEGAKLTTVLQGKVNISDIMENGIIKPSLIPQQVNLRQQLELFNGDELNGDLENGMITQTFTLQDMPLSDFVIEVMSEYGYIKSLSASGKVYTIEYPEDSESILFRYFTNSEPLPELEVVSIAIIGNNIINEGGNASYSVLATFSDNSTASVTGTSLLTSTVGAITSSGKLSVPSNSIVGDETTLTISATFGGLSATKIVTVIDTSTTAPVNPTLVFRETFAVSDGTTKIANFGWKVFINDDATGIEDYVVIQNEIGVATDTNPINSGISLVANTGFADIGFGNNKTFTYTEKYPISNVNILAKIGFSVCTWKPDLKFAPALKIGGQWYVLNNFKNVTKVSFGGDPRIFEKFDFVIDYAATNIWMPLTLISFVPGGPVPSMSLGSVMAGAIPLGEVTAFGVYTYNTSLAIDGSPIRIDNYEITVNL